MKKVAFVIYSWSSTILFSILIIWLATVPNFEAGSEGLDEAIKVLFRMTLYSIFFLLLYRSIIVTLKSTIDRLAKWRSRREEIEDAEFVLVIETLVVIITILSTIIFSSFEEYIQSFIEGRHSEIKDVLISTMTALLTGIVVYSVPILGEIEVYIKTKFENAFKKRR